MDVVTVGEIVTPVIVVSDHAVERARQRYRDASIGWPDVKREVRAALEAGRIAKRVPGMSLARPRHGARCCWSADRSRVYLLVKRRSRPPHPVGPMWLVITALDPVSLKEVA